MAVRVVTWNLERKKPTTPTGSAGVEHLRSLDADVMVLTEARLSYPTDGGYLVHCQSWGSDDERKVVMWSRHPWSDVDDVGSPDFPPARFVAATTETPVGPIRVLGVCISWHMANVQYGDRNRRPWEDHICYCEVLELLIAEYDRSIPLVIAGDYNQRVPNARPTRTEARALTSALESVDVVTAGPIEGCEQPGIDHIAVAGLAPERVWAWPNVVNDVRCSDHGGVAADLVKP